MKSLPKVGMRIIKSAVAVFLCFLVYLFRQDGVPFYSVIAAVLCMQPYVSHSVRVALNRCIGTLIGGVFGTLVLLFEQRFIPHDPAIYQYLLVSLCIIPLIYITVLVKKPTASYITCVVFMSITVAHGADVNPYLFAFNRCLDTLIGIGVSLGVNAFRLPRRKNRHLLFVAALDALAGPDGHISAYTKVKYNQLLTRGAHIAVASRRPPAYFLPLLEEIELRLPVIVMGGAALYDVKKREYVRCHTLPSAAIREVSALLEREKTSVFIYAAIHHVLHIYYGELTNPAAEELYHVSRGNPHQYYVCGRLPRRHEALMAVAADTADTVERLAALVAQLPCAPQLHVRTRPDPNHEGYAFLEIVSAKAGTATAVEELRREAGALRAVTYGLPAVDKQAVDEQVVGDFPRGDALIRTIEKEFVSREQRRTDGAAPDSLQE